MAPGPSLKQKIQQKLLKPKYTPHKDDEALRLCTPPMRSGSTDIVLDAVSSRASSRPASTEPTSADTNTYHDITASLLGDDAATAGRSDQGPASSAPVKPIRGLAKGPFKGCLPFGKPPLAPSTPNGGLPTAFNNRGSILSRLNKAARKPAVPAAAAAPPQPKAKAAPKATPVKTKKVSHPLHMAAWRTNISELQQQLDKAGADPNKRDRNSMTPLHYAAWQGSIDCVQLLLEHKADINKGDAEGMLPIHFAAMFNRLDVAAMLLDRGSHLQPPPAKRGRLQVSWPTTPLIVAAKMGHTDMVALLMDRGADIKGVSKASKSALHEAALTCHADVVSEMLRKGADHDMALPKTGYRALHLAALKGSQPVVQALLLGGANVDVRAKDGRTPLHLACEHGHMEAAAALIGLGGADLSVKDTSGLSPLHVAVDKNHLVLAKTLMDAGAPVDTATNLGALPLNFAHDPDFYKLLRAVRWYSAASCPSGNNPSSSSYWSPPGAMEATTATAATATATAAGATATAGATAGAGLPVDYFGPDAAAADAQYFGGYGSAPAVPAAADAADDDLVLYHAPSPTQGLIDAPAAAAAAAGAGAKGASAAASSSKGGLFSKAGSSSKTSSKGFPASSWLKSLQLPGKNRNKAAALTATATLAQGGFSPLSAAAAGGGGESVLPTSSSAVDYVPLTAGMSGQGAGHSRSNSRTSSISLAAGGRRSASVSAHHSPSASEGSSIVARNAAAEIARAAVAAVVERAAREEHEMASLRQQEAAAAGVEHVPHRSHTSSPETWSYTSSVPARPHSAITASAASGVTTQATLRRLLGFEEDPANLNVLGKVAPGDVDTRRSIGDQDRWLPGTAATPSSAATFAAFAADAAQQDDVKAAAALAASGADAGSSKGAPGPKPTATAAAAAFTAAAAAAAAAAVGGAHEHADAVKEGGSPGSAGQGSAGKKASRTAGKGLRPWRS